MEQKDKKDKDDEMNIQVALEILEIMDKNNLTQKDIKKKYYQMALKWHPDKNKAKDAKQKFQRISKAYEYLCNEPSLSEDVYVNKDSSPLSNIYMDIVRNFINNYGNGFKDIIYEIMNNFSLRVIADLDKETLIELYQFLYRYATILNIPVSILEVVLKAIEEKYKKDCVFVLKPLLKDVMDMSIYKLYIDSKLYLVPLWHSELYFDTKEPYEIIVLCQPILPDGVEMDENNNILFTVYVSVSKDLPGLMDIENHGSCYNSFTFEISGKSFDLPLERLYIKKEQKVVLKGKGIPKICERDIYNVSNKGDVIVHVVLVP